MKEKILKYVIEKFGYNGQRKTHYSYCMFPEESCSCKNLNEIDYDTSLITGGYIDSFSMVEVLVYLEKIFDVKIPEKEATPENFNSVNKMVELVTKHTK